MKQIKQTLNKMNMQGATSDLLSNKEKEQLKSDSYNKSIGNLNEQDGYNCDICHNKGMISKIIYQPLYNSWQECISPCKCYEIRKTINRLKASGLKNIIKEYTFDKYKDTEEWQKVIKQQAVDFVKKGKGWFFISGQSGCGKTHLCTAISREFLLKGKRIKYMLWRDDVIRLKNNVNDFEMYNKLIGELKDVEILYIDDLFKTGKDNEGKTQRPTVADINIAFELLNYRYNNHDLITIISSECLLSEIIEIDEAIGGRIAEKTIKDNFCINIKRDNAKNYRLKGMVEL